MPKFNSGVRAEHVYRSIYKVFCNNCEVSIGTMDFRAVVEAVFDTLGRGGVLCPPCRKSTCDICGVYCADHGELSAHTGPKGLVRLCVICSSSMNEVSQQLLEIDFSAVVKAIPGD